MSCCSKVKAIRPVTKYSGMQGDQLRQQIEKEAEHKFRGSNEEITSLVKNFEVFADQKTMELEQSAFQQMLGFIGDSFLGERLFYVVKKENRETIGLLEYLVYNDVIYYGSPEEKFINSFKMMDLEGQGQITLNSFIEFWKQFFKMYG